MTRIHELLAAGQTFSFEFFPPKNDAEHASLVRTLFELQPLEPSFVSVTYRGGPSSRRRTVDLVSGMLRTTSLTPMAHVICVGHTRLELAEILVELRRAGIENLMALGGDRPGETEDQSELGLAVELVELARAIGGFSIGVAAHPAGHPRSASMEEDRDRLVEKMTRADFAITQFFFEAEEYSSLVADLTVRGMNKPVVPGIMPVTSLSSVPRMAQMGAPVPAWMVRRLESAAHSAAGTADEEAAVREEGTLIAAELCRDLLDGGSPGLHFYTLNRSRATRRIYDALRIGTSPQA